MKKINFVNGQAPALNASNLNQLQTNAETAINEGNIKIEQLQGNDDWQSITTNNGTLFYKKLSDNLCFVRGSFSGIESSITINLPFSVAMKHVFLLAGNANFYTKAYTTAGTTSLSILVGTGSSSTTYELNHLLLIN